MLGSANSPLSMFNGGGGSAFQAALAQGTGPASALADALKGTVDRYHQVLNSQQDQVNKLAQIQAETSGGLDKEKSLIDYKNSAEQAKADAINAANKSLPNNGLRRAVVDGRSVFLQDKVGSSGIMEPNVVQPAPYPTMDQIVGQKAQAAMDAASSPNIIQQGASGAVADATGAQSSTEAQTPIRVKLNASGQTGTIPANEYDPNIYTRI